MDRRCTHPRDVTDHAEAVEASARRAVRRWRNNDLDELRSIGLSTVARCLASADPTKGDVTHYIACSVRRDVNRHARERADCRDAPAAEPFSEEDHATSGEDAMIEALEQRSLAARATEVLATLPDRQQTVARLTIDGLSLAEIAAQVGASTKTVWRDQEKTRSALERAGVRP